MPYAVRTLMRRPGFALAIILTLALGIGANTGMFSVVYGILLRPLPYQRSDRLVLVEAERDVSGVREPVRVYFALAELDVFRRLSAFGRTEAIEFATVSDTFFTTVRGGFRLGRGLDRSDAQAPSLVISERLWRRAFAASPDVIGRSVILNSSRGDGTQRAAWRKMPFTIVGVANSGFQFPSPQMDGWTAAEFVRTISPRCCSFSPIARLKDGSTLTQASADSIALT